MLENDPRMEVFPEGVEGGLHAPPPLTFYRRIFLVPLPHQSSFLIFYSADAHLYHHFL